MTCAAKGSYQQPPCCCCRDLLRLRGHLPEASWTDAADSILGSVQLLGPSRPGVRNRFQLRVDGSEAACLGLVLQGGVLQLIAPLMGWDGMGWDGVAHQQQHRHSETQDMETENTAKKTEMKTVLLLNVIL